MPDGNTAYKNDEKNGSNSFASIENKKNLASTHRETEIE